MESGSFVVCVFLRKDGFKPDIELVTEALYDNY